MRLLLVFLFFSPYCLFAQPACYSYPIQGTTWVCSETGDNMRFDNNIVYSNGKAMPSPFTYEQRDCSIVFMKGKSPLTTMDFVSVWYGKRVREKSYYDCKACMFDEVGLKWVPLKIDKQ